MIRLGGHDDATLASVMLGDTKCQVICLRPRAREHRMSCLTDAPTTCSKQLFGVGEDAFMKIARMRAKFLHLPMYSVRDAHVSVANGTDIVVRVQVFISLVVVQQDATAVADLNRLPVEHSVGGAK